MRKTLWFPEEDETLKRYMQENCGRATWIDVVRSTGLKRCPKSCRLRWVNYLRPGLKHGPFSSYEIGLVASLHAQLGNRWSNIASHLPGRSDNAVKNAWHAYRRRIFSKAKQHMQSSTMEANDGSRDDDEPVPAHRRDLQQEALVGRSSTISGGGSHTEIPLCPTPAEEIPPFDQIGNPPEGLFLVVWRSMHCKLPASILWREE